MTFRSIIIGIASTAFLLVVLGFARMFSTQEPVADLKIREVETLSIEVEPPPPPPETESQLPPPPPIALTELSSVEDTTRVAIPEVNIPINFTIPVETFHLDIAPSALPVAPKTVKTPARTRPTRTAPKSQKPRQPKAKSHYTPSELDNRPRLIRRGPASFPRTLARKGVKRGTVVLEVELSTRGSVSVRRVISSTYPELIAPARRAASGSRYTSPKRNGQPVKAILRLPVVIQK